MQSPLLYSQNYIDKQFERGEMFGLIQKQFNIQSALYPGSFVHITPSFFIPLVIYVDSDKNAKKFFSDPEMVKEFIDANKTYREASRIHFIFQDYHQPIEIEDNSVDLLISQWAGPVSQKGKRYLKVNGILLANNSHADAGMAFLDQDFELVGVIFSRNGRDSISDNNLTEYFIPKRIKNIEMEDLLISGKGIAYTKTAPSYIFKKIG